MVRKRSEWISGTAFAVAVAAVGLLASSGPARALSYFDGPGGFGFDNESMEDPLEPTFLIMSQDDFAPAGTNRLDDGGEFALAFNSKQKAVKKGNKHWRVKVSWNVQNKTGDNLDRGLIVLTALAGPPDFPQFPDYRGTPIDVLLDSSKEGLQVVKYTQEGVNYYFLGLLFEDMAPGKEGKIKRKFKYDLFRKKLKDNRPPAIGVSAILNPVVIPEPSVTMLLGAGAALMTWWSRRRRE